MASGIISRIRSLYAKYLPLGDLLGEMFYAVWMVVVSLGILGETGFEGGAIAYVVMIAFGVNLVWGLIDGLTVMHTRIIDRAQNERIIYDLQTRDGADSRKAGDDALSEGITAVLDPEVRQKILDMIASTTPSMGNPYTQPYHPRSEDWHYVLGIVSIDVILVVPLVMPFLVFSDPSDALYISRLIATLLFAILGALYAKNLNRRRLLAALFLGTLCFSLFTLAYMSGW